MEKNKRKSENIKIVLIFLATIGALFLIFGKGCKHTYTPNRLDAYSVCEQFINDRLKAPSTADYPLDENHVKQLSDTEFIVNSWVDAQNSFGAKIRTYFVCRVKYVGNDKWKLEKIEFK